MQYQPFLQLIRVCSKTNTTVIKTFCREQLLMDYIKREKVTQYTINQIQKSSPLQLCDACPKQSFTQQTPVGIHP